MLSKIKIIWHTVKYLRAEQIFYRAFYKIYTPKYNFHKFHERTGIVHFDNILYNEKSYYEDKRLFSFINLSRAFSDNIDWEYSGFGRLWTYNLNYFEYLNQKEMDELSGERLIDDYIRGIDSRKVGMEPYPLSLRIMNWIKFFSRYNINNPTYNSVLYSQAVLLSKKIEYHLLGNHLLENGFSLLWSAYYFNDQLFYDKAHMILSLQLKEQILNDGGHFELSPMYHSLMLFRVLDSYNIVSHSVLFNNCLGKLMGHYASIMLGWLKQLCFSNQYLPLLNDSAEHIAPTLIQLESYASSLNIEPVLLDFSESGYRKFKNDKAEMIVDVGRVGPAYQPGHAHADTLSFELYIANKPVIIDTGVSSYNINERRFYERSTAAHNTVVINNINSSQVWSGHRVAKRAEVKVLQDANDYIEAIHDGYNSIDNFHRRTFSFRKSCITISDYVNGTAESYLHFAPTCKLTMVDDVACGDGFSLKFRGINKVSKIDVMVAKQFNSLEHSYCLKLEFTNHMDIQFDF